MSQAVSFPSPTPGTGGFISGGHNPDILTCLANLSADEVFTPPKLAAAMLDTLPPELFTSPETTFLDPCTKSGVFLREIAKRLNVGLATQMPDEQARVNHILTKQVFGLATGELTWMLARRSLYCSKKADGRFSICTVFDTPHGNIHYPRTKHQWNKDGRCEACGANAENYEREESQESYAYPFIHGTNPEKEFSVKFDVIVGNPPYQLSDGGNAASAIPIYQKFVTQAKRLQPKYLTMVIPSRWFAGGRGLGDFRDEMLRDDQMREMNDYLTASDCFPGVEIKGGVVYFLWERGSSGDCKITTHEKGKVVSTSTRPLLEKGAETFVRYSEAIGILRKVQSYGEESFASLVSANDPFGFDVREENSYKRIKPNYKLEAFPHSVLFYYNGWRKSGIGHIDKGDVRKNKDWMSRCKVLVPKAWGVGNMTKDWIKPFIAKNGSCCSETYIVIGPFGSQAIAKNAISYTQTRFFHLLIAMMKISQESRQHIYKFIPLQDFGRSWSDGDLYAKYKLTPAEIAFIERNVHPDVASEGDDE